MYNNVHLSYWGLPRWFIGKETVCQCRGCRRCGFDSWFGKIPWIRKWQLTPVFLPGKFHGQRSLVGYSPWGCKESDTTEHAHHYIIVQISLTALEVRTLPVHPFPHTIPENHMFNFLHNLLFLEFRIVGNTWLVDFPDWPFSLRNTQLSFLHVFSWLFHFIFDDFRCGY